MSSPRFYPRRGASPNAFYAFAPPAPLRFPLPLQADALADPADETVEGVLTQLLPRGAAWGTPDNQALDPGSVLARFWRAVGSALGDAYRALFRVSQESTATTLVTSLPDWEIEYGLPDPCLGPDQTFDQRIRALLLKIRSGGTITPGDFIRLAADAGYTITIEEPQPFAMGRSEMGGDEGFAGGERIERVWIVKVPGVSLYPFIMGEAEMGLTPFGKLGLPADLICLFNAVRPAWTKVIFSV